MHLYEDRRLASKKDMEEIAWMLTTIKPTRHVGFASAVQFRQMQEAAEDPADVDADPPQSATRRD